MFVPMYPGDSAFVENVKNKEQVIRLRNHPCIVLWCGNIKEVDEGWHNWGWQKTIILFKTRFCNNLE